MISVQNDSFVPGKDFSRRTTPRVEVLGQLHGQPVTFRAPLVVRDISAGGFAMESPIPFRVGSVHLFRFTSENGDVVFLSARAAHGRQVHDADKETRFVSGFEFLRDGDRADQGIETLLKAATSVLQFRVAQNRDSSEL